MVLILHLNQDTNNMIEKPTKSSVYGMFYLTAPANSWTHTLPMDSAFVKLR